MLMNLCEKIPSWIGSSATSTRRESCIGFAAVIESTLSCGENEVTKKIPSWIMYPSWIESGKERLRQFSSWIEWGGVGEISSE
jgi:hypothetical protein